MSRTTVALNPRARMLLLEEKIRLVRQELDSQSTPQHIKDDYSAIYSNYIRELDALDIETRDTDQDDQYVDVSIAAYEIECDIASLYSGDNDTIEELDFDSDTRSIEALYSMYPDGIDY